VYLYEYSSDIIFPTVGISQVNQGIADFLRISIFFEYITQVLVSYHFPQTIGAEQQTISRT
jgi:4-hydroxy-3-methylbut-2-en-1-yl diphosphate synthase IspG/GcpE